MKDSDSLLHVHPAYSLKQLTQYFLKLGALGFGGPIALVGYMHRDLVEERQWVSEAEYQEGLTLAQVAPGPLAAQLSFYLGYVHYGFLGSALVGLAFVLPSFLIVVALGWAYTLYGGLNWMQAVFYGVGAAVIGIIAISAYKLTRKTVGTSWLLWSIYLVNAATTIVTESERVELILGSGALVLLVKFPPKHWIKQNRLNSFIGLPLIPLFAAVPTATTSLLGQIALFFTQAGAFVFGSGLAIVPFLYGGVVKDFGWLNSQQFLDAVAVAMITPGPVVITTGFIGFLVAGFPGACVAAIAMFIPCYLLTVIPAPYFKKHGKNPKISTFVNGVTVAATGAIAGAVVVLGRQSLHDLPTFLIGLIALISSWKLGKKLPEPLIIVIAAIAGVIFWSK
ncbi:chromate transporter [Synechococcus elongatus]|uniref:Probable chromate transport protein n=1 Tax=Synechococcus elongatus (strain ATCC 33912 / PCC 7942 / FACHB-805) TaxID=1140 RepID=SRPC_SYNE7|nr:chromate transporter [Synechococcus elongatus]Q55027.1 RecName: Full=Probable chromate transport protein [Synechococcus elongatus PCC 7942 = FACHB-805]pir/C56274/ ChrA homolog SrpC, sulfur-regulated - Synechococcus sp. (strain PCC 7942) plasmid pANL [Synechococcus sp.]AAA85849.1 similar to a chromate resistance protein (ChrA) from A. eutrophus, Swiss-Prot Accession Number P17551 [Synechococcus elongatus PCC 7942 = FACHB-805]AAM81173.1 ANL48 [Synechococcus elongatus PCC 7942 = FACHB-805]ABB5